MLLSSFMRSPGQSIGREVQVGVRGGYDPDAIRADTGVTLQVLFRREESAACSEQVVFPAFGKSATLPRGEQVVVDLLPDRPGEYEFTCGMGVLRGRLVVSPGRRCPVEDLAVTAPGTEGAAVEWWLGD